MPSCPRCARAIPGGAPSCPWCGTSLSDEPQRSPARSVVTVLFCDVVGSTALGARLDPESVRGAMSRYFELARRVIEHHGGTVEKFIGDAVMAVFGVPAVHEDDALRAVRAAAELRDSLAGLNKGLEADLAVAIDVRMGVNTGEVVTGDPATGQALVTGDAVNVAARLEQMAAPGETLIGAGTLGLVRDAVVAEPVEPLAVKGKEAPIAAFRLLDVAPLAPGRARRMDVPLVARSEELGELRRVLDEVLVERSCRLAAVMGVAGVGKSRLVEEFLRSLSGDVEVLRGRCLPYGEAITYWPIAEIIRQAVRIGDGDDPVGELEALLHDDPEARLVARMIADLLGLPEGAPSPRDTFWACRRFLEAVSRTGPLVVTLDDLHWAEPALLDLLEYLVLRCTQVPILLLGLAREELLDLRPEWSSVPDLTIRLEPLDGPGCAALTDHLLEGGPASPEIVEVVASASEGNPLFVEELVGMLVDEGTLRLEDGSWSLAGEAGALPIPSGVRAVLDTRLASLPPDERAVLECASVIGEIFYWDAVAHLAEVPLQDRVDAALTSLGRKDVIRPHPSDLGDEDAFRFRHILLRDAAYGGLSKGSRARLHEAFADWLSGPRKGGRAGLDEIVGYHLEQAHRMLVELGRPGPNERAIAHRAGELLTAAGYRAWDRGDARAALSLGTRASALLEPEDPIRVRSVWLTCRAHQDLADIASAAAELPGLIEAAERAGDLPIRWLAELRRLELAELTDPSIAEGGELLERPAREAVAELERLGDVWSLCEARQSLGFALYVSGRSAEAEEELARAAGEAERAGRRRVQAWVLTLRLVSAVDGPTPIPEIIDSFVEALRAMPPSASAETLPELAWLQATIGRFDEARAMIAEADEIAPELGLRWEEAYAPWRLGWVEFLAGNLDEAERQLRRAYELLERLENFGLLCCAAYQLGEVLIARGELGEALELTEVSERYAATDDLDGQIGWRRVRALALARTRVPELAERLAREAVDRAEACGSPMYQGEAGYALADVLRLAGRLEEAADAARTAMVCYEQKQASVLADRARRLLDECTEVR